MSPKEIFITRVVLRLFRSTGLSFHVVAIWCTSNVRKFAHLVLKIQSHFRSTQTLRHVAGMAEEPFSGVYHTRRRRFSIFGGRGTSHAWAAAQVIAGRGVSGGCRLLRWNTHQSLHCVGGCLTNSTTWKEERTRKTGGITHASEQAARGTVDSCLLRCVHDYEWELD